MNLPPVEPRTLQIQSPCVATWSPSAGTTVRSSAWSPTAPGSGSGTAPTAGAPPGGVSTLPDATSSARGRMPGAGPHRPWWCRTPPSAILYDAPAWGMPLDDVDVTRTDGRVGTREAGRAAALGQPLRSTTSRTTTA